MAGRFPPKAVREHAKCQHCGCNFTRKVADRVRGWAKCCSKSCAAKMRFSQGRVTAAEAPKPAAGRVQDIEVGPMSTVGAEFDFYDDQDAGV